MPAASRLSSRPSCQTLGRRGMQGLYAVAVHARSSQRGARRQRFRVLNERCRSSCCEHQVVSSARPHSQTKFPASVGARGNRRNTPSVAAAFLRGLRMRQRARYFSPWRALRAAVLRRAVSQLMVGELRVRSIVLNHKCIAMASNRVILLQRAGGVILVVDAEQGRAHGHQRAAP